MSNKPINWYPLVIIFLVATLAATFATLVLEKSKPTIAAQSSVDTPNSSLVSTQQYHWKMVTSWPKNTPGLGVGAENIAKVINEMSGGAEILRHVLKHTFLKIALNTALGVFDPFRER